MRMSAFGKEMSAFGKEMALGLTEEQPRDARADDEHPHKPRRLILAFGLDCQLGDLASCRELGDVLGDIPFRFDCRESSPHSRKKTPDETHSSLDSLSSSESRRSSTDGAMAQRRGIARRSRVGCGGKGALRRRFFYHREALSKALAQVMRVPGGIEFLCTLGLSGFPDQRCMWAGWGSVLARRENQIAPPILPGSPRRRRPGRTPRRRRAYARAILRAGDAGQRGDGECIAADGRWW